MKKDKFVCPLIIPVEERLEKYPSKLIKWLYIYESPQDYLDALIIKGYHKSYSFSPSLELLINNYYFEN